MTPKDPGDRRRRARRDPIYERLGERLIAIFVLGIVLFNPLFIRLFDRGLDTTVFGVPLLFLYLFGGWAMLIALLVCAIEGPGGRESAGAAEAARSRRLRNGSKR
jgi:hypothetical protein